MTFKSALEIGVKSSRADTHTCQPAAVTVRGAVSEYPACGVIWISFRQARLNLLENLVIPAGFEPATPRLGIWCSILLSYGTTGALHTRLGGKAQTRKYLQ